MSTAHGKTLKFLVVGLMPSEEFQLCQFLTLQLYTYYPEKYIEPQIRPMLDVEWTQHLLKLRRQHGGDLWKLKVPVAVFLNGSFFGDNNTLQTYVTGIYSMEFKKDFLAMGQHQLVQFFTKMYKLGRNFVYLTVSVNYQIVGSLLIMLYTDLVPETCNFFLERCRRYIWQSTLGIRVVPQSFVQFRKSTLQVTSNSCENYAVPHDRRGVVSMSNIKRYFSTSDFHISLAATPWMNYKYVAFGQVIQGEETLHVLENLNTVDESPVQHVEIVLCGEFSLQKESPSDSEQLGTQKGAGGPKNLQELQEQDVNSETDESRYRQQLYCAKEDLRSYAPFSHLPPYLFSADNEEENESECSSIEYRDSSSSLDFSTRYVNKSRDFHMVA